MQGRRHRRSAERAYLSPKVKRLVKAVQLGDDLKLPFVKCDSDPVPELSKEESSSVGVVARDDEGDALKEFEGGRGISAVRLKHQWDDVRLMNLIHRDVPSHLTRGDSCSRAEIDLSEYLAVVGGIGIWTERSSSRRLLAETV
jgi:hypothetical protein